MIYNLVPADEIIARLDNDFNIRNGDFIARIPQWIHQCLSNMEIACALVPKTHIASISSNYGQVPSDIVYLEGIEYNGRKLNRTLNHFNKKITDNKVREAIITTNIGVKITGTVISQTTVDEDLKEMELEVKGITRFSTSDVGNAAVSSEYYSLHPNGVIETSFSEGIIAFHYYTILSHFNEVIGGYCPLIPDNEFVKDAIVWDIITKILQRGYTHPVFKLDSPNPITNPYDRYRAARLAARVKSKTGDRDYNRILNNTVNSTLYNIIANPR